MTKLKADVAAGEYKEETKDQHVRNRQENMTMGSKQNDRLKME